MPSHVYSMKTRTKMATLVCRKRQPALLLAPTGGGRWRRSQTGPSALSRSRHARCDAARGAERGPTRDGRRDAPPDVAPKLTALVRPRRSHSGPWRCRCRCWTARWGRLTSTSSTQAPWRSSRGGSTPSSSPSPYSGWDLGGSLGCATSR